MKKLSVDTSSHDNYNEYEVFRQQQQRKQSPPQAPVLTLGDFSRYGYHTLEMSQEIKSRL